MSAPAIDLDALLRRLHLPTVRRLYPELAQRAVAFGQNLIDGHCRRCRFIGRGRTIAVGQHAKNSEPVVVLCDAGISDCVIRVSRDRFVIADHGFGESFFGKSIPKVSSAKVGFVRLRIVGAAFCQANAIVPA